MNGTFLDAKRFLIYFHLLASRLPQRARAYTPAKALSSTTYNACGYFMFYRRKYCLINEIAGQQKTKQDPLSDTHVALATKISRLLSESLPSGKHLDETQITVDTDTLACADHLGCIGNAHHSRDAIFTGYHRAMGH